MEDVLDVYKRPYDSNCPLICMDELSKQLIKDVTEAIPAKPGKVERFESEYIRNGTCKLFLATEPLAGHTCIKVTERRAAVDWADFIKELVDEHYPEAEKLVLVMDNLNIHAGASLYKRFEPAEAKRIFNKLEIHYTPKHGSWLNMAEIELSRLARQCLGRRIPNLARLKKAIQAWLKERNKQGAPINWQFTTEDARVKLTELYPSI